MPNTALKINSDELRDFSPLNQLSNNDARELLSTSITTQLSAGTPLFQPADGDKRVFYLLEGEIRLVDDSDNSSIINSASPTAKQPMGHHLPDQYMAVANKDSVLLSFDADMLELFLSWTTPDNLTRSEANSHKGEWLDLLLQSRGLLRFSEEQIDNLLSRMNEVHFSAGDVVIRQDDKDEYYYVIKNGRASVSRKPDSISREIKLAELHEGDAFGEEALLSDTPRSATITMEEDGNLMRLPKTDFSQLLAEPLLSSIDWNDTQGLIKLGSVLLDVRLPDEFERAHIPGSLNIPLALLRLKMKQLSIHRKYIICCDDGSRSSVAAFLLNRHGLDTYILDGGINENRQFVDTIREEQHETTKEKECIDLYLSKESIEEIENTQQETPMPSDSVKKPVSTSFADRWGHTVEEPHASGMKDCADIEPEGKTTPFASTKFAPIIKDLTPQPERRTPTKHKTVAASRINNSRIVIGTLGLLMVGAMATAAFQQTEDFTNNAMPEGSISVSPAPNNSSRDTAKQTSNNVATVPSENIVVKTTNTNTAVGTETTMPLMSTSINNATGTFDRPEQFVDAPVLTESEIAAPPIVGPGTALDPATRGFLKN